MLVNNLSVPTELTSFFKEGPGKTLLVKGNPGAGKTIFAFTLLRELKRKGVYLSTRVDTESLYSHISWLKESLPVENIVDATQSERQKPSGGLVIKALKYTDVPDFLKGVYERTERVEHSLVIIDSWDAVVSHTGFHEPREREKLEHNLCDFSRKTATDMIFIAEYVEQKPLDYLVDGVLITVNDVQDMRRIRTLELQKLRGGPIKQPVYLYSLHDGVFRAFSAFKGYTLEKFCLPPAIPDIRPGRISTGIKDLDLIIGGYGSFNLCQGDRTSYHLLQLFLILNSIGLGKQVVLSAYDESLLENAGVPVSGSLREKIKIIPETNIEALSKFAAEPDSQGTIAKTIFFVCLDEVSEHGKMAQIISDIGRKGGIVSGFASEGTAIDTEIESLAATSLVARMHFGVPGIYSNIPVTGIYAMTLGVANDCPELSLTPIE